MNDVADAAGLDEEDGGFGLGSVLHDQRQRRGFFPLDGVEVGIGRAVPLDPSCGGVYPVGCNQTDFDVDVDGTGSRVTVGDGGHLGVRGV